MLPLYALPSSLITVRDVPLSRPWSPPRPAAFLPSAAASLTSFTAPGPRPRTPPYTPLSSCASINVFDHCFANAFETPRAAPSPPSLPAPTSTRPPRPPRSPFRPAPGTPPSPSPKRRTPVGSLVSPPTTPIGSFKRRLLETLKRSASSVGSARGGHARTLSSESIGYPRPAPCLPVSSSSSSSAAPSLAAPQFDAWLYSTLKMSEEDEEMLDASVEGYSPVHRSNALDVRLSFASVSSASAYSDGGDAFALERWLPFSSSPPHCLCEDLFSPASSTFGTTAPLSVATSTIPTPSVPSLSFVATFTDSIWEGCSFAEDCQVDRDEFNRPGRAVDSDRLFAELSNMLGVHELGW